MDGWNPGIDEIMAAQRIKANNIPRSNPEREKNNADKDSFKKDLDLLIHVADNTGSSTPTPRIFQIEQESINLTELIQQLKHFEELHRQRYESFTHETSSNNDNSLAGEIVFSQHQNIEKELTITLPHSIVGLMIRSQNHVETDRYLFEINCLTPEISIIDKWTQHSTRIWSHIVGEEPAARTVFNHVTFMLMDGTRLTISANADGIILGIDIIKGNQHILCQKPSLSEGDTIYHGLEMRQIPDGFEADANISRGFVLFAGGTGNDWFTVTGKLIWGHAAEAETYSPLPRKSENDNRHTQPLNFPYHQIEKSI